MTGRDLKLADDQSTSLVPIDDVPVSVQDLVEHFGLAFVVKLIDHFGGVELRVPANFKSDHKLLVLGEEDAKALCAYCPGDRVHVPMSLQRRNLRGHIESLEQMGLKRWEQARTLGITERHVRRLANSSSSSANQLDMFEE